MSIFKKFWTLLTSIFVKIETDYAKVVVTVLQEVKVALNTGAAGFIANVLDGLTKSQIPTEVIAKIQEYLPALLATALAIEAPPANADAATIQAWEQSVMKAWGLNSSTDKVVSVVGADLIAILSAKNQTFAQRIIELEQTYQDMSSGNATVTAE